MLTAAVLAAVVAAGPGPGGGDEEPNPFVPHSIRTCAQGLVMHNPAIPASIYLYANSAPAFSPPGAADTYTSLGISEGLWYWDGVIWGDLHGQHTVIHIPQGTVIDLYLPGPYDAYGPWLEGYTVRAGDWDLDGKVNSNDISAFLTDWLTPPGQGYDGEILRGDYDLDGLVTSADIQAFLSGWLSSL